MGVLACIGDLKTQKHIQYTAIYLNIRTHYNYSHLADALTQSHVQWSANENQGQVS